MTFIKESKEIFTFESVHFVLKAEKILKEAGIEFGVIPTPRAVSAACGVCVVTSATDAEKAQELLSKNSLEFVRAAYPYDDRGSNLPRKNFYRF